MALSWDAFLIDEAFDIPNDPWPDITAPPTDLTSDMPKTAPTRTPGSQEPGADFDSLLNGSSADPYFDDSLFTPNDYFLSDLEVLQPSFGESTTGGESTSESSPEPSIGTALTGNSPLTSENSASFNRIAQMPLVQRPSISRANTFPNPQYESLFPNNLEPGSVEDLTFPNGPNNSSNSTTTATERKFSTSSVTKRPHRAKADILSACWTSPLCPNHDQDGPPPNPSSCGGGCAPFLFANDDTLPTSTISNLLKEAHEVIPEDGVVEIKSHSHTKRRSESDVSAGEPHGRQLTSRNTVDTEQNFKAKSDSEDPPQARAEEDKAKPRRRLPHNQVERKYRESLNTQLESLRRVVPSLQQNQHGCDGADIEDLPAPSKPSKAVILASATAHIKNIEKDKKVLQDENQLLKTRIKALQALVKCEDCSLMQYVMDLKINQQK